MRPQVRRYIGRLLVAAFVVNSLFGLSPALNAARAQQQQVLPLPPQNRIIVVNADQPNLWTLEQAHYLLSQMHRRNLDLRAKRLEDLDPNEINGLRFDVMRMLIEFGATFNQADLQTNRLLSDNRAFNAERRQQLMTERDGLRRESLRLTGEIEELETEKAGTADEDAKKRIDARVTAKTARRTRVDAQIEQLNTELGTLAAPSGTPTATTGGATFDPARLPKSEFDEAFKAAAARQIEKFNQEPQLNATLRLDNFLQMQYEIISKQLSLLRDELGPGERLVFLELPQTVNAAHHESKRKWAQSWWRIAGYTRRVVDLVQRPSPTPTPAERQEVPPITIVDDIKSILRGEAIHVPVETICQPMHSTHPSRVAHTVDNKPSASNPTPLTTRVDAHGRVTKVTVTLHGLRHPRPADLDVMLVGPRGQNAIIMSDVGGDTAGALSQTITFDDDAPNYMPAAGPLPANVNTYRPTNAGGGAGDDAFDLAPLGGSALSVFNETAPGGEWKLLIRDDDGDAEGSLAGWTLDITTECTRPPARPQVSYHDEFVDLNTQMNRESALNHYVSAYRTTLENRMVRTVELIPRQGSLNVNDMNLRVKSGAFNFVLSTLFGFGSRLNVQRQREQFSQFVQQELYSAAFGKGAREFGWTFTPMPGTERLMSGVRTTYAVVVVPEEATSLVLESNGCYFPRSAYQPHDFAATKTREWNDSSRTSRNCNGMLSKSFVVPIPRARANTPGNDFWVKKINFQAVEKGKRIVVLISGENFSPQTGVLINGVPLLHSIGLAQPLIRDDSDAGREARNEFRDSEVTGNIERIDPNKIVFSFKMSPDFKGTPAITLIAPGRAIDLNWLDNIEINNQAPGVPLSTFKPVMFGQPSDPPGFRVEGVRIFRTQDPKVLTALVSGAGFRNADDELISKTFINGAGPLSSAVETPTLLQVTFAATSDPSIKVTLVSNDGKTAESEAVANPSFLSVSDVEVTTYETDEEGAPATLLVRIRGTGFTDSLEAVINETLLDTAVKSATEAVFTMPDPRAAAVVTLRDSTGQRVKVVVTRQTRRQP